MSITVLRSIFDINLYLPLKKKGGSEAIVVVVPNKASATKKKYHITLTQLRTINRSNDTHDKTDATVSQQIIKQ